jgi:hypothetical protein
MAYSKTNLKSSGGEECPYRPFCTEKLSDKSLPIRTLRFSENTFNQPNFMGAPNSV